MTAPHWLWLATAVLTGVVIGALRLPSTNLLRFAWAGAIGFTAIVLGASRIGVPGHSAPIGVCGGFALFFVMTGDHGIDGWTGAAIRWLGGLLAAVGLPVYAAMATIHQQHWTEGATLIATLVVTTRGMFRRPAPFAPASAFGRHAVLLTLSVAVAAVVGSALYYLVPADVAWRSLGLPIKPHPV
jgi:hypothetical protein